MDAERPMDPREPRSVLLRHLEAVPWGIAFEVAFTAVLTYLPPLQPILHTAPLGPVELATLLLFPLIVWAADEARRARRRRLDAPA